MKTGPGRNDELLRLLIEDVRAEEIGRHQVGRELDAAEAAAEQARQREREQRLAGAGHAFEQHVAAGERAT